MRKILCVILMLLCAVMLGCGSEPEKPKKPSLEAEAKSFNQTYYEDKLQGEYTKVLDEAEAKYGRQPSDEEFVEGGYVARVMEQERALKEQLNSVKFENPELEPLRALLIKHIDARQQWPKIAPYKEANFIKNILQTAFAYRNNYSLIVDKKPLPVVNSSVGQLYASVASDVWFGIPWLGEVNEIGEGFHKVKAQGKFIVVGLVAYNDQKDAVTIDAGSFKLIDKEKREYSTSPKAMTALELSYKGSTALLEQVNPRMSFECCIAFDVPKDSKKSDYELQASGGMTGEKVLLPLRVRKNGF